MRRRGLGGEGGGSVVLCEGEVGRWDENGDVIKKRKQSVKSINSRLQSDTTHNYKDSKADDTSNRFPHNRPSESIPTIDPPKTNQQTSRPPTTQNPLPPSRRRRRPTPRRHRRPHLLPLLLRLPLLTLLPTLMIPHIRRRPPRRRLHRALPPLRRLPSTTPKQPVPRPPERARDGLGHRRDAVDRVLVRDDGREPVVLVAVFGGGGCGGGGLGRTAAVDGSGGGRWLWGGFGGRGGAVAVAERRGGLGRTGGLGLGLRRCDGREELVCWRFSGFCSLRNSTGRRLDGRSLVAVDGCGDRGVETNAARG